MEAFEWIIAGLLCTSNFVLGAIYKWSYATPKGQDRSDPNRVGRSFGAWVVGLGGVVALVAWTYSESDLLLLASVALSILAWVLHVVDSQNKKLSIFGFG